MTEEKRESIKDVILKTKDSFTLKQLAMAAIVAFGTAAYIIADYIAFGFDASIFSDPAYWINLVIGQSAVTIIMFTVYNFTSDREESANAEVIRLRQEIYRAHCSLTKYGLSEKFDDYVYLKNLERKKFAYTHRMQRKIHRTKKDDRRKVLQKELEEGLKIVESLKVRYNKVSISEIFSRAVLPHSDDEDLSDGKAETTRQMLLNKVVSIVMFGILLSTLSYQPKAFSGILLSSFVKLFQAAYAIYAGGSAGVAYVRGKLLTSLDNRAQFIQKFVEKHMPSEQERRLLDESRQREKDLEEQAALERRKAEQEIVLQTENPEVKK